jgi:hypothetical protein
LPADDDKQRQHDGKDCVFVIAHSIMLLLIRLRLNGAMPFR